MGEAAVVIGCIAVGIEVLKEMRARAAARGAAVRAATVSLETAMAAESLQALQAAYTDAEAAGLPDIVLALARQRIAQKEAEDKLARAPSSMSREELSNLCTGKALLILFYSTYVYFDIQLETNKLKKNIVAEKREYIIHAEIWILTE